MERYSRQIMLPEIGNEGQKKLSEASVLLVGVGGLGSPISLYLTGAGIGRIGLIDADVVSESNLQRQVLYTEQEIGLPKVECAKRRLHALSGNIQIDTYQEFFSEKNAMSLVKKYDLVIDGCDMTNKFEACTNAVKESGNQELLDFVARRLYEMAAVCVMSHLLIQDATTAPEMFAKSALVYVNYAESEIEKHFNFIRKFKAEELESYRK